MCVFVNVSLELGKNSPKDIISGPNINRYYICHISKYHQISKYHYISVYIYTYIYIHILIYVIIIYTIFTYIYIHIYPTVFPPTPTSAWGNRSGSSLMAFESPPLWNAQAEKPNMGTLTLGLVVGPVEWLVGCWWDDVFVSMFFFVQVDFCIGWRMMKPVLKWFSFLKARKLLM